MRYSDRIYLSKFSIDPEYEELVSQEDWEDSVSLELLANDDALDEGDGYWNDTTDR